MAAVGDGEVPNGALPAEDAPGEVTAAIAQAQTISAGTSLLSSMHMIDDLLLLDEIALYDRQIRLWGVQAQER